MARYGQADQHAVNNVPGHYSEPVKSAGVSTMLTQVGVPALPTRGADWRELTRQARPVVRPDAGRLPATVTRHADLADLAGGRYAATRTQLSSS